MIYRRSILILALLGSLSALAPAGAEVTCYKCKAPDINDRDNWPCNTCPTGEYAYVSCIPYCNNTCSVGTGEGCSGEETFNSFRLAPDGSWWQPSDLGAVNVLDDEATDNALTASVGRNCIGLIGARLQTPASLSLMSQALGHIAL